MKTNNKLINEKSSKKRTHIRMDEETHRNLEILSVHLNKKMQNVILQAINNELDQYKETIDKIKKVSEQHKQSE